ncbi:MAG TPA: RNA ligase (ATP) [Tissierellaceae bacterium]|nr:RNA ligase (ATP) [Tissierellaceae bacterium]
MGRKLVSIRTIDEVKPIEGADRIEACRVGGWWVVGKKGEYKVGDKAIYCEIDSWIPHELAPFLSKNREPREYGGIRGERLSTVKLRGQISQGLLLPLSVLRDYAVPDWAEGRDLSAFLGVIKWEPPIPAVLSGEARGVFPNNISRTHQERVQNLGDGDHVGWHLVTEKLDGASMTAYLHDGEFGVCSRNVNLREDSSNTYWKVARDLYLENVLNRLCETTFSSEGYAIQGELVGEGIQGNPYGIKGHDFYVFDIWDIKKQAYIPFNVVMFLLQGTGLKNVPVVGKRFLDRVNSQEILKDVDGLKSVVNPKVLAEGVVYKSLERGNKSFKAISNEWLLRGRR